MTEVQYRIPLAVISAMGLTHDGQTVSKMVRINDLLADGKININDYHALASAGVVVLPWVIFTFETVEETAKGWLCTHMEPDKSAWLHTYSFIKSLFTVSE
ncbi:MAG: hypothetical protein B7C55_09925 [Actinomycetales bacterium mxb001]|nr:MAG: hypothetical protein B7C55_09925 [Actinomycetales bacterium mxb001]